MGKVPSIPLHKEQPRELQQPASRKWLSPLCWFVFFVQLLLLAYHGNGLRLSLPLAPSPKPGINWTPCGDNIDCGRLSVLLDYHNESLGTVNLAVARYRATNTTARIGTLLTNPGGPGGSGVNFIYRAGARISILVDGRYDIVSWDPRGINGTTPRVDCFYSQTAQDLYNVHTHNEMGLNARNLSDPIDLAVYTASVRHADAANAALAKLCIETSGETLRHVGTATVVRDLEYLSRIIEGDDSPVNFWGFSYGTAIGSYFVNMFPDRVGRVIIDGVVDPTNWANVYLNEWFKYDLVDTDRTFEIFLQACQKAGPDRCALASDKSTAGSIGAQVDKLLDDLYEYPLPVDNADRPGVLTSGMVKDAIYGSLYTPRTWPELATNLAATIRGNGTAIMNNMQIKVDLDGFVRPETTQAVYAVVCVDGPAYPAIVDKAAAVQKNIDEAVLTYELTSKRFPSLELDMCHYWTPRETERFTGPFNSSLANPILIIGNTADPATPLANAKAVKQLLKNDSGLLIQAGPGHASSAMASLCTGKAIRDYFFKGELPPEGITCATDEVLFPPVESAANAMAWMSADVQDLDDQQLLMNLKALGEEIQPFLMRRRH